MRDMACWHSGYKQQLEMLPVPVERVEIDVQSESLGVSLAWRAEQHQHCCWHLSYAASIASTWLNLAEGEIWLTL
jgi:hypothetical protein